MRPSSLGGYLPSFSGYCLFFFYVGYLCFSPLPGFLMEGGGREGEQEGGRVSCQGHSSCTGLLAHSPVTLISLLPTHLGSQDANHIPKASLPTLDGVQHVLTIWDKVFLLCVCDLRESTGFLLFCLPLLSRAAEEAFLPDCGAGVGVWGGQLAPGFA